jgi:hypothetical protein
LFSEASFGHTGYSGSSIWIDPKQDLFVIFLTNRINYRDIRKFSQLRSDISTIAVAEFRRLADKPMLIAVPEVERIPSNLPRKTVQKVRSASHGTRLIAVVSEKHSKAYHQSGKKNGKKHRNKSFGRTQRA